MVILWYEKNIYCHSMVLRQIMFSMFNTIMVILFFLVSCLTRFNGRMDIIRVNVKKNVQQKLTRRWVFRNVSFGDSHCIQIVIR